MEEIKILTYFVLAVFVGFEVVSKVSSTLHTPLMSGANAIHGIILVGSIIVAGHADTAWMLALALLAVLMATVNLVGGFVVTDRMLEMFSGKKKAQEGQARSVSLRQRLRHFFTFSLLSPSSLLSRDFRHRSQPAEETLLVLLVPSWVLSPCSSRRS